MRVRSISNRKFAIENRLSLSLFVFRIDANHTHHTLAVNDFALVTHFFYRSPDFHFINPLSAALLKTAFHL